MGSQGPSSPVLSRERTVLSEGESQADSRPPPLLLVSRLALPLRGTSDAERTPGPARMWDLELGVWSTPRACRFHSPGSSAAPAG